VRWRIERKDGEPFTVAALWDTWKTRGATDPVLHSFSMLTINADGHPLMGRFHAPGSEKRSLVVVPPDLRAQWLASDAPRDFLQELQVDEFTGRPDPLPPPQKTEGPAQLGLF